MRDLKSGPHILPPTLRDSRAAQYPFPKQKKRMDGWMAMNFAAPWGHAQLTVIRSAAFGLQLSVDPTVILLTLNMSSRGS